MPVRQEEFLTFLMQTELCMVPHRPQTHDQGRGAAWRRAWQLVHLRRSCIPLSALRLLFPPANLGHGRHHLLSHLRRALHRLLPLR